MPACRPCMIRHNTIGLRHYLTHVWDLWYIELVQTIQEKKMNKIEITFLDEVRETIEWLKRTADSYHITTS